MIFLYTNDRFFYTYLERNVLLFFFSPAIIFCITMRFISNYVWNKLNFVICFKFFFFDFFFKVLCLPLVLSFLSHRLPHKRLQYHLELVHLKSCTIACSRQCDLNVLLPYTLMTLTLEWPFQGQIILKNPADKRWQCLRHSWYFNNK